MDNIRMAARVCQGSFRRILYMPRFYIAFLWLLFLYFPLFKVQKIYKQTDLRFFAASYEVVVFQSPVRH